MEETKVLILKTSMELFSIHGYDRTPISLILEKTGLSKGGFYHHFNSKEEILDHLAKNRVDQAIEIIDPITKSAGLSAVEKFNKIFAAILAFRSENAQQLLRVYEGYLKNTNLQWKNKIDEYTMSLALPYYSSIIAQGVEEGIFNTPYPELTAETIVREAPMIRMKMAVLYINKTENPDFKLDIEIIAKYLDEFIHRSLGAESGLFKVADMFVNFFETID